METRTVNQELVSKLQTLETEIEDKLAELLNSSLEKALEMEVPWDGAMSTLVKPMATMMSITLEKVEDGPIFDVLLKLVETRIERARNKRLTKKEGN